MEQQQHPWLANEVFTAAKLPPQLQLLDSPKTKPGKNVSFRERLESAHLRKGEGAELTMKANATVSEAFEWPEKKSIAGSGPDVAKVWPHGPKNDDPDDDIPCLKD